MPDATPQGGFACPDLTTFCRLDGLCLEVTGQRLESARAVLACRVVEADQWCRRCGCEGVPPDTVARRLAHEPFGWRPTTSGRRRAPAPLHRLWTCVASGHQQGRRAAGEAVLVGVVVGAGGDRRQHT